MEFHTVSPDKVISGYVVNATATYAEALEHFFPLIGRLDMQRDPLQTRFYSRLEDDIVRGCVMPPITIALIHRMSDETAASIENAAKYISDHIHHGFVLDGIQRLTTLERASRKAEFNSCRPIHVSFVLTDSRDRLLYRMITLNNGQRPMSARHQIEVLADSFFDFGALDINLITEKGAGRVRASSSFKKGDFVKGYVAYLSNSVNIDNQKIIEEKMDELIASRIIESDIPTTNIEFSDVVELVNFLSEDPELGIWLRVQNNFIGFCVGIKSSLHAIESATLGEFAAAVRTFEAAFSSINVSKVNLGKLRRELVSKFIGNYGELKELEEYALLDRITDWI
ncbi:hypothetical protein [Methyloversatilis discipulorum]|uniref:hypothetical protein n=1 Tax=Methyloversatilis discipulorum TaxID=1119528 RepID=UPI0004A488DB|nr:hypothetical protein [Methyloversatilis discipulorum]